MSILDSFTKKKALTAAINQTAKARHAEGNTADALYKAAYHDYADVLVGDPLRSDALYHWGFALLHQAKTKTDIDAFKLLEESIAKFSFCLLLNPSYLGAAINGGVACMDLARLIAVDSDDALYEQAKTYFEQANAIQAGSASYNLACIYGLRDEGEACLQALENAKNKGSLPDAQEIMNDPDLDNVKNQPWFIAFMEELAEKAEAVMSDSADIVTEKPAEPVSSTLESTSEEPEVSHAEVSDIKNTASPE